MKNIKKQEKSSKNFSEEFIDYENQDYNKQKRKNKIDRDRAFKKSKERYDDDEEDF